MLRRAVALALLPFALAGCPSATNPAAPTGSASPGSFGSGRGGLSDIVAGSVVTREEQELRDIQTRQTALAFPVKIGVLFFDYRSGLKAEDRQASIDDARAKLVETGHVREVFQIPSSFLAGNESLDGLRKVAARFQADVLLIVSGDAAFGRSDDQSFGFWDVFNQKSNFEARMSMSGLGLDVFAGTFMTPLQVATKAGPATLDPADANFQAESYRLQKQAESDAFAKLREQLATGLGVKRAELEANRTTP